MFSKEKERDVRSVGMARKGQSIKEGGGKMLKDQRNRGE